jgi:hypothetical protein
MRSSMTDTNASLQSITLKDPEQPPCPRAHTPHVHPHPPSLRSHVNNYSDVPKSLTRSTIPCRRTSQTRSPRLATSTYPRRHMRRYEYHVPQRNAARRRCWKFVCRISWQAVQTLVRDAVFPERCAMEIGRFDVGSCFRGFVVSNAMLARP